MSLFASLQALILHEEVIGIFEALAVVFLFTFVSIKRRLLRQNKVKKVNNTLALS